MMNITEIFSVKRIHFIGIGGISMSGLCEILLNENCYSISGSDNTNSPIVENLMNRGVKISIGQSADNISKDIELVIYTAAIKSDNEEFKRAEELGIKMLERSTFVGMLMKAYDKPICVSGTHGKTTTSSMISEVFIQAEKNPTLSIGGILSSINSNVLVGDKEYFIVETCEYCDTFLKFNPHSGIILNVEEDHLDYFNDFEHILNSFKKFANLIKKDACLSISADIENYNYIIENLECNVMTYGKNESSDWKAIDIQYDKKGYPTYKAFYKDEHIYDITLNVLGEHNIYNSLSVCVLAYFYGLNKKDVEKGLFNFKGTERRFEYKGTYNGATIIDDYAHHPTEIIASIETAKRQNPNQLWCVFQPHTYTRTKTLLDDFAKSFKGVDNILILDIYSAREIDTGEIHSKDLSDKICGYGYNSKYIDSFENAKDYVASNLKEGDIFITMGAGDVNIVGEMLIK